MEKKKYPHKSCVSRLIISYEEAATLALHKAQVCYRSVYPELTVGSWGLSLAPADGLRLKLRCCLINYVVIPSCWRCCFMYDCHSVLMKLMYGYIPVFLSYFFSLYQEFIYISDMDQYFLTPCLSCHWDQGPTTVPLVSLPEMSLQLCHENNSDPWNIVERIC